jgi:acyl-CoA dehydrogenase
MAKMAFYQAPPEVENPFADPGPLREHLRRVLPADVFRGMEPSLLSMAQLAAGELHDLAVRHRLDEPTWTPWDAWGNRVDRVEVNRAWERYASVAAESGLVATAYERAHGEWSRLHQFALVALFAPFSQTYTCPLAMTDGCARTLEVLGSPRLCEEVLPRLTSRHPAEMWTSGQWMTERTGGSDVGLSETTARRGDDGKWRLHGTKWFTSAVTSEVALTLARPEGNGPGGKGLALFFVPLRDRDGRLNGITVNRLKDKLGTRHLPTAELTLDGTVAELVAVDRDGIRNMASMLNVTRTWNAVCAVAGMGHGLSLARSYAHRRVAFGAPLADKPLHLDTLAGLSAEYEASLHLVFHEVHLMGRIEAGVASSEESRLLAVLQPVTKLFTGKGAVAGASEVLESFGGAGYVEDTGLPQLLRDAQVLSIWEGTTNVLSLETLRALAREDAWGLLVDAVREHAARARDPELASLGKIAVDAAEAALRWAAEASGRSRPELEAGARRFALTLARAFALALTVEHAEWALAHGGGRRARAAARRFAAHGIDRLADAEARLEDDRALALGLA